MRKFLQKQNLDYPDFQGWVLQTMDELTLQIKLSYVALKKSQMVGAIVFQRHFEIEWLLEIKNVFVKEKHRNHGLGRILFALAECAAKTNGLKGAVYDCPEKNRRLHDFVYYECNFRNFCIRLPLYKKDKSDIVLVKFFCNERLDSYKEQINTIFQNKYGKLI